MDIALFFTGIFAGFTHSLYSAVSKALLKNEIREPFLLFLYINAFQAITTPVIWIFKSPAFPAKGGLGWLMAAGLSCVIAFLFLYSSLSRGDASSVMPILGSKVVFAGILAIFFLQETHTWATYLAAVLVAVSIGILSYSPTESSNSNFSLGPTVLMILCSITFAFTDNFISRSLHYIDPYNFLVYYNLIVGMGSLIIIPYLKAKEIPVKISFGALKGSFLAAIILVISTLFIVISFDIANGVVIPNILIATRGIFIVLISAFLSRKGIPLLENQANKIYVLRLFASSLIVFSIWIVVK